METTMSNLDEQRAEIARQTEEFEKKGGKIKEVEAGKANLSDNTSKAELKAIQQQKRELAKREKEIKAKYDEGKEKRKEYRRKVTEAKSQFEKSRKELSNAIKVVNSIHLTKSVQKHFDEFNGAIATLLLRQANMENASKHYLQTLRDYKEN